MSSNKVRFAPQNLANANSPDPSPNIPPDPDEGELRWDDGFLRADHQSLKQSTIKRYEILVPQTVASTVQSAVKKTVAILLAYSKISVLPHVKDTSRNAVQNERDFPIEVVAMKDYIFDVGKIYHNGVAHFKACFLVETRESLSKIKKNGAINPLRDRRIFVQEFESDAVFESREIGFLCNLHPIFTAREKVTKELIEYVREITGESVHLKLKLTNRYFGNQREGFVKSQYLALHAENKYSREIGTIIGTGLEKSHILKRWKNVKLLPTRPSLHKDYDKEKFLQVLQIHNKTLRETKRVAIKNMWVGDYGLIPNDDLHQALGVPHKKYSFRQLLLETANSQNIEVSDFYVTGSQAFVVCKSINFTKTCDFIDTFLTICKEKYGAAKFAKQMRCFDYEDPRRHPVRVTRPVYTSPKGVQDMIQNIGPGVKLLRVRNNTAKTFTSHRNERSWSQVLVTPSRNDSNTSPLTSDTNSKIENLHKEVSSLRKIMNERTQKNKEKIDLLTETVHELKEGLKMSMMQQEKMNQTIMEAVSLMQKQMAEITATQTKIQTMFLKMSGVYSPLDDSQNFQPITQPEKHNTERNEPTDDDSMDYNMTNLKRTREDRTYDQVEILHTPERTTESNFERPLSPTGTSQLNRLQKTTHSDPPEKQRKGHAKQ